MAAVFEADTGSAINKVVLLALADHAADDGTSIYPSVATISRKSDLSERVCQDALRESPAGQSPEKAPRGGRWEVPPGIRSRGFFVS
jgi:hypothetical protein